MGYLIIVRYILKTLLGKCKDSGKVSEIELYFYLFYFANYSEYPNKVKKRNIFVLEHKGQIAVSAEELSQYFKVARNTITARLKGLIDDGFVKIVSNSKVCNVYEIVSYGDTKFMIEQLKPIDISNENGNFSKVVEQQTQNFEQLNEQLKTQNFEQQKKQIFEQLKPIDICIKNGNYSKDIEQPKTQNVEQLNEQPKTQNVEQLYLNNLNNNKSPFSIACVRAHACEGENLTDKEREQKIIEMVETSNSFADEIRTKCNDLKIPITEGFTLFEKFKRWCDKNRKYHKDVNDYVNHFLDWLVDIHTPTPTKWGVDKETFERLMQEPGIEE